MTQSLKLADHLINYREKPHPAALPEENEVVLLTNPELRSDKPFLDPVHWMDFKRIPLDELTAAYILWLADAPRVTPGYVPGFGSIFDYSWRRGRCDHDR